MGGTKGVRARRWGGWMVVWWRDGAGAGMYNLSRGVAPLWAYATMGRAPSAGVMRGLEGRAEAVAMARPAQYVPNTLWAHATMGRAPSAGVTRRLAARAATVELPSIQRTLDPPFCP